MDLAKIQKALEQRGVDGWLLSDFHNRDQVAYRVLGLDGDKHTSRRWFVWIPTRGEPVQIVSRVEPTRLDALPGDKHFYRSWKELHAALREAVTGASRVAMNYSPMNDIPYVDMADPGVVELLRSFGPEIVSSAELIQEFEALLGPEGFETHAEAGARIQRIKDEAFALVGERSRSGNPIKEHELQQHILRRFEEGELDCMSQYPIVGVGDHPADPHFEPTPDNERPIAHGETLLIDLWAKLARPGAVFYDITWCGYVGDAPPAKYVEIFDVVCRARDACLELIRERIAATGSCLGCDADDACRLVVDEAGYGEHFVHRTGHSIGEEVHGSGANLDNLETRDDRELRPGCCFSIEPGIYLAGEMAVRTEIDGFIKHDGEVAVVGDIQRSLILIDG